MKRNPLVSVFGAVVIVGIILGAVYFRNSLPASAVKPTIVGQSAAAAEPYTSPPIASGNEYRSEQFRFALDMPEGFTAQELQPNESGVHTVVLQDAKGNGIQILVTPNQGDSTVLTADDVHASIPDMKVTDEQPVEIGPEHTGVAFLSDNDAFGGSSREVWFYFRGNLYQISTYARLDKLLQAMFATWKFY